MGAVEIFLVQKTGIVLAKHFRTNEFSYSIVNHIACYGGDCEEDQQPFDMEESQGGKGAEPEQQRISRQKWCNDETGFAEYYKEENEISPATKELNDGGEMPVQVNKKICKIDNQFHFLCPKNYARCAQDIYLISIRKGLLCQQQRRLRHERALTSFCAATFLVDICSVHVIDFLEEGDCHSRTEAQEMHELSVTESILKIVLKHAEENKAEKVLTIGLKIGELSELVGECIQHYFDYLSKDTIAEGAVLEIERAPIVFDCTECKDTFQVSLSDTRDFTCPQCHGAKVTLVSGREFYIKDITIS